MCRICCDFLCNKTLIYKSWLHLRNKMNIHPGSFLAACYMLPSIEHTLCSFFICYMRWDGRCFGNAREWTWLTRCKASNLPTLLLLCTPLKPLIFLLGYYWWGWWCSLNFSFEFSGIECLSSKCLPDEPVPVSNALTGESRIFLEYSLYAFVVPDSQFL